MSSSEDHIRSMRWLYDDEESYRKAIRKLKLDELKEIREQELQRQRRRERLQGSLQLFGIFLFVWFGKIRTRARQLPRQVVMAGIVASAAVLIVVIGWRLVGGGVNTETVGSKPVPSVKATAAPFKPVIQPDTGVQSKYDAQKKVLAFPDKIGSKPVTVSQQPFPKQFTDDPAKFQVFLDGIPKRQTYPIKGGAAYMAVDDKGKVLYSVITTSEALVFVRAGEALAQNEWIAYFKALK